MQQPTAAPNSRAPSDLEALVTSGLDSAFQIDPAYVKDSHPDSSWWGHIPFGQWLVATLQPNIVVELGQKATISYDVFCRTAARLQLDTACYLVGGGDETEPASGLETTYDQLSMAVRTVGKNSPNDFGDGTIDLLHFADVAKGEEFDNLFKSWKPKLSDRAVVLLHHINSKSSDLARSAWPAFAQQYSSYEFHHSDGLGIVAIGTNVDPALAFLFSAPSSDIGRLRGRFAILGSWWQQTVQERFVGAAHAMEVQNSTSQADLLRQAISVWERQWRESNQARAQVVSRLRIARRDLYNTQLQNEALSSAFNALQAERDQAFRERDVILSSRAWLVAGTLVKLAVRFPKGSRLAWRMARLCWWTVTLQLVRRLREWRRIRTTLALQASQAASAQQAVSERNLGAEQPVAAVSIISSESSGSLTIEAEAAALMRAAYVTFLQGRERLKFPVFEKPNVSAIVVTRKPSYGLLECLRSLRFQSEITLEVIVIDTGSQEISELLAQVDNVSVIAAQNGVGLVEACNQAVKRSRGQMIALVDNCVGIENDGLAVAQREFKNHSTVGAMTGRVLRSSGAVWEAGGVIWSNGQLVEYGRGFGGDEGEVMFRRKVDYSGGTLLLTSRAIFDRVGHFDRSYGTLAYACADYAMRLRVEGYFTLYEPRLTATMQGLEHEVAPPGADRSDCDLFVQRHGEILSSVHLPAFGGSLLAAREHDSSRKKHLLMIDNEVPYRALGSGYPRANEMLWVASDLGWSVTLFPLRESDFEWNTVQHELPEEVEVIKRHGADELRKLLAERHGYYQAILVSRPDNMEIFHEVVRDAPHLLLGSRLIYDAEAVFGKRELVRAALEGKPYSPADAEALLDAEAGIADGADGISCVTAAEAEFFKTRQHKPVYVISHSVKVRDQSAGFASREGFLFIGRLLEPTAPNWMGLKWFIDTSWPAIRNAIPSATLTVIGHLHPNHEELAQPGVQLLGPIVDLNPYYDRARVFVAPVRFAAGVPIKILEAAAAGVPVAGTSLMAEQLLWRPGLDIIAEDNPALLAEGCVEVHDDSNKWSAMRANALFQIEKVYSPKAFRRSIELALLGSHPDFDDWVHSHSLADEQDMSGFQAPSGSASSV
jgi:glycosyltransferase involved in cell wall biosynthesis